ncbi:TaqI-like C-terminal specificity domain-containing protein, partial [Fibrobacter sp.]|uniref:TaqI-like C-terminal specificity domain-containing protein n=1 Tax=Fibrobacter sp. TaxID=35828 RepID=UPI0025BE1989
SVYVQQNSTDMNFNNSDSWVILSSLEQTIKQKIEKIGKPLKNWNITINYGIKTGFNDAFIISSETRKEILSKCANEDERKRTDAIIRPILRGRDIQRYTYVNNGLWLINTHNGMKGKLPKINIDEYPAIKTHLDRYWDKISTRADKGDTPYNLRNCAYLDDFDKPKIIYPETTVGRSQFYYDDSKFMLDKTCFFISGEKLKFLEGMLTSKIIEWYLERMCRLLGKRTIQYSKQWIEDIPIASPNEKQEKDVVEIVDEITDNIKNDSAESQQKINLLIKKLNAKIGEIYNLNEQELDFIGVR